jgi:hypothetical protein
VPGTIQPMGARRAVLSRALGDPASSRRRPSGSVPAVKFSVLSAWMFPSQPFIVPELHYSVLIIVRIDLMSSARVT